MARPCYIGDETSALAWRLAGLRVHVPKDEELLTLVMRSCDESSMVLISAAIAQRLPEVELDTLLARVRPPVVIVPDVHGQTPLPDLSTRLRLQLGVLE
ncbi:MAG: V-type ATP synthase subunit F [Thiohalobacterales bacterium]|nr:V-type ATP synthase subunit F [Thiohalobacterales bacterium]